MIIYKCKRFFKNLSKKQFHTIIVIEILLILASMIGLIAIKDQINFEQESCLYESSKVSKIESHNNMTQDEQNYLSSNLRLKKYAQKHHLKYQPSRVKNVK